MKVLFNIKGLDCANCAMNLESEIKKINGIGNAIINFMTEKLEIEFEGSKEEILNEILKVIKREEPDVTIEEI